LIGRGKDKGESSASGAQSWRELAGPKKPRVNSPQARKRRLRRHVKLGGAGLLLVAIVCAIVFWLRDTGERDEAVQIRPPSKPIEKILFESNGVLPDVWLSSVVDLKPGMSLMDADIHSLKRRLEGQGQVKAASVERVFPNALKIDIQERIPVMRMAVASGGQTKHRIVSRTGVLYDGIGYSRSALRSLPYIQPYQHPNGKYLPLQGIERVADLLELARQTRPKQFSTWQVVNLTHFSGDLEIPGQIIEIRTRLVPRVIFSASRDFAQQLDRLDYILRFVKERGNPSMERIDLSLRGSAAVQFTSGTVDIF